jgi:hypothetical protein
MGLARALDGNGLRIVPGYVVIEGLAVATVNYQGQLNQYISDVVVLTAPRIRHMRSPRPPHYQAAYPGIPRYTPSLRPRCHATSLKGRVLKYLSSWDGASLRNDRC